MQAPQSTVISQYAASPIITALVDDINAWIDPSQNINQFYNSCWNIQTAFGNGLAIWGRIVGVTNVVQIPSSTIYFGFLENLQNGGTALGFGQAPFWNGSASLTRPYNLPDAQFRQLILAKALANITNCSAPAINQILLNLFPGRGNCYVSDNGGMSMTYVFDFTLSSIEVAIVNQSGVLPRPAGVLANVVIA